MLVPNLSPNTPENRLPTEFCVASLSIPPAPILTILILPMLKIPNIRGTNWIMWIQQDWPYFGQLPYIDCLTREHFWSLFLTNMNWKSSFKSRDLVWCGVQWVCLSSKSNDISWGINWKRDLVGIWSQLERQCHNYTWVLLSELYSCTVYSL